MVLRLKPMGKLDILTAEVLDRTKVLHGPRTQTFGETRHPKSAQVLDRTNVLYDSRTQTYGETIHSKGPSARQNQGLAWSSDSNL